MPLHEAHYKHWEGSHLGVWHRRLAISRNGLKACLQNKLTRNLLVVCWITSLIVAMMLFLIGQLLVADSTVVQALGNFNPGVQAFARMLTVWLEQHPEISVRCTQNVLFYFFCIMQLRLSIFVLGMALPFLITRDLGSNAIIIYSSKALNRGDYLIGKFGTAFGLVALTWLGPVFTAWLMGNLLAPDWHFFWHSRIALGHMILFALLTMTFLSVLALGVSALSSKEKATSAFWFLWWILGGVITPIALHTQPALRHLSFNFNLQELALGVFRIGDDIKLAQEKIPVLGEMLGSLRPETLEAYNSPELAGAVLAMVLMLAGSVWVILKKVKPE
jgi:hypothetical protein